MCEDLKEPIVFKTSEIRVKVENYLNNLEFADILQTCEFLGYLDGIHEAGGINKRGYEFYHTFAINRFKNLERTNLTSVGIIVVIRTERLDPT